MWYIDWRGQSRHIWGQCKHWPAENWGKCGGCSCRHDGLKGSFGRRLPQHTQRCSYRPGVCSRWLNKNEIVFGQFGTSVWQLLWHPWGSLGAPMPRLAVLSLIYQLLSQRPDCVAQMPRLEWVPTEEIQEIMAAAEAVLLHPPTSQNWASSFFQQCCEH